MSYAIEIAQSSWVSHSNIRCIRVLLTITGYWDAILVLKLWSIWPQHWVAAAS